MFDHLKKWKEKQVPVRQNKYQVTTDKLIASYMIWWIRNTYLLKIYLLTKLFVAAIILCCIFVRKVCTQNVFYKTTCIYHWSALTPRNEFFSNSTSYDKLSVLHSSNSAAVCRASGKQRSMNLKSSEKAICHIALWKNQNLNIFWFWYFKKLNYWNV